VVEPLARSYTSTAPSVSEPTSCSAVWKNTRVPPADRAFTSASCAPFPPAGPVDSSVVVAPARSYTSIALSVSDATSFSEVSISTRLPSFDAPLNEASCAPFPPAGPVDSSVVVPPARSYTSPALSVSEATSCSSVVKNTPAPSADAPR
jgi:hypothetical protein